jgi:hypothetical protein
VLTGRDLRAVLDILRGSYGCLDAELFASRVMAALDGLIPSDLASFNDVDPRTWRFRAVVRPAGADEFPGNRAIFARHLSEHPFVVHRRRVARGAAVRLSDLVTRAEFHRLPLYHEYYRRIGTEYQLAVAMRASASRLEGIAFSRRRPDFSERERRLLDALAPHLRQGYRNALAATRARERAAVMERGLDGDDQGLVLATLAGRVRFATARARCWLAEYFGSRGRSDGLPESLARWIRHHQRALRDPATLPPVRAPLVVERAGRRLEVVLLADGAGPVLLLRERRTTVDPAGLERLGLTGREAQVLAWVAEGKTNADIGAILGPGRGRSGSTSSGSTPSSGSRREPPRRPARSRARPSRPRPRRPRSSGTSRGVLRGADFARRSGPPGVRRARPSGERVPRLPAPQEWRERLSARACPAGPRHTEVFMQSPWPNRARPERPLDAAPVSCNSRPVAQRAAGEAR